MHEITRVRHELVRRRLEVLRVQDVTPAMRRIWLGGDELDGFTSLGADDHVKIFVSGPDGEPERRDYTPRRYDPQSRELALDFAIHEAGPATAWALGAQPGDDLEIAGPRGSQVVPTDFDWWLLIGDETALPAIGRRIEELPAGTPVISIAAVGGEEERQDFAAQAKHEPHWVYRPAERASDPAPLLDALAGITLPEGDGYIWIAAEANVARALRNYVLSTLQHPARGSRPVAIGSRAVPMRTRSSKAERKLAPTLSHGRRRLVPTSR